MRIAAVAQSVRETNYFLIQLMFGASLGNDALGLAAVGDRVDETIAFGMQRSERLSEPCARPDVGGQ